MRMTTTAADRRTHRQLRSRNSLATRRHRHAARPGQPAKPPHADERRRVSPPRTGRARRVRGSAGRPCVRWVVSGGLALLSLIGSAPAARAESTPADTLAQPPQQPAGSLGTGGVRTWILDNLIPLLLLAVALLLLWLGGGKGDNAGIMKRLAGVLVALAIVGLAVTTDAGKNIGVWLAGLFSG
jgi:hypothetical protein